MVSPEKIKVKTTPKSVVVVEPGRISFSADFLDDDSFISITPDGREMATSVTEFEFLCGINSVDGGNATTMLTADELFFQGKLLPYWQLSHATQNLTQLNLKASGGGDEDDEEEEEEEENPKPKPKDKNEDGSGMLLVREEQEPRIWFVDDDPSPRPPKCTVLWKELLRLKKQRGSTLSPPSSSSFSSSSSSLGAAAAAAAAMEDKDQEKEGSGVGTKPKHMTRIRKGLERSRSASLRIRPMLNLPISTLTTKTSSLPPLFPIRKTMFDR